MNRIKILPDGSFEVYGKKGKVKHFNDAEHDLGILARSLRHSIGAIIEFPDGSTKTVEDYLKEREGKTAAQLLEEVAPEAAREIKKAQEPPSPPSPSERMSGVLEGLMGKIRIPRKGNCRLNLEIIAQDVATGRLAEGVYRDLDRNVIIATNGTFVLDYSGYSSSERQACLLFAKERLGLNLEFKGNIGRKYSDESRYELDEATLAKLFGRT